MLTLFGGFFLREEVNHDLPVSEPMDVHGTMDEDLALGRRSNTCPQFSGAHAAP